MLKPLVIVVALVTLLAGGAASAQTPTRTISVNGSAEVRVAPNEVILTVGIETNAMEIARARTDNDTRVKAIAEAARAEGVASEHIKTDFLDIQPRYADEYKKREFLGYFARRTLVITLRDVTKFESLLTAVLGAGANYVHGIDFRTTELRKHRDTARQLALTAAREKAEAMAAAFKVTLGAPMTIQEGYSGWWSPYASWWGSRPGGMVAQNVVQDRGRAGADDDALVPGQLSVSANVSVTFELGTPR
jgi:uncharacterized protein YggE